MAEVLEELLRDGGHSVVYTKVEEVLEPRPGPPVEEVVRSEVLVKTLKGRGIHRFYAFQAEAIEAIREGKNVLILASTGAGKTEAFLVPILDEMLLGDPSISVVIYPTKALARDQLERINAYTSGVFGLRVATYDGDTPEKEREMLFKYPPRLLVTNPDMLHLSLRQSPRFRDLVRGVSHVVLDDAHVYSGVFGSHVHYVLKRLRRAIGAEPQLVAASATIGNPEEFAEKILGSDAFVVNAEPVRKAPVYHVMLEPKTRARRAEVIHLMKLLSAKGLRTLVFVDSHRLAESLAILAEREGIRAAVHRAGLLPEERRKIEAKLKRGELDAVVATPTLELGIDVGELDAVVMYGIPPTFSKYVQRAGRVGRRGRAGYVLLVLGNDPISSYYGRHPEEYYGQRPDPVFVEPRNEEVAKVHLLSMSAESVLRVSELTEFERTVVESLLGAGLLKLAQGGYLRPTRKGLAFLRERDNIRGVGEQVVIVTDTGRVIGHRELPQALKELFPGAIYLHGGRAYMSLRLEGKRAVVKPLPAKVPPISTSPLHYTVPAEEEILASRRAFGIPVSYLSLSVQEVVYGYVTKTFPEGQVISQRLLESELSYSFRTKGILLEFPPKAEWTDMQNAEAFHAVEHALIYAAQMVVGAGPTDLGGISFPTGHIFVYDAFPGGSGVSAKLFQELEEALKRAYDITSKCSCEDGCPRCIFSPYCGNNNKVLSRRKASEVLAETISLKLAPVRLERSGRPLV
ncbi:MAG: DEAD/DEAH box helicase [Thermofilum sp.]